MKYFVDDSGVIKALEKLDKSIRAAYSAWKNITVHFGIEKLREIKGFHLEKLKGARQGQLSCRLNRSYRVIFKLEKGAFIVIVLEVNKHEY